MGLEQQNPTNGDLGRGSGALYDVLELRDGMTARELIAELAKLPPHALIGIRNGIPETINADRIRIPVCIRAGRLSEEGKRMAEVATLDCKATVLPYWNTLLQYTSETCHRPLPCPVHYAIPETKN